ncbi:MAG: hypothetical protein Q9160_006728 [Pyrenula sp. 1 TL-2023]
MGKRKKSSRKPQGAKKREPLATSFSCLFCNHDKAVTVRLDKKNGLGTLSCKICGQKYQSQINYLSQPVDVYSDWIDACEQVAKEAAETDAKDREFSSYGLEERRPGMVAAAAAAGGGAGAGGGGGGAGMAEDEDEDYGYE